VSDLSGRVRGAIERLSAGDTDAFFAMFASDAKFFVGGHTRLSGDHDAESFRRIAGTQATGDTFRREIIGIAASEDGAWADAVVKDYVRRDTATFEYHAVLEFQSSGDAFTYFWIYVHEYDQFDAAWR
jgi:hypothetical protein